MENNPYDTSLEWTGLHRQPRENVRRYEGGYSYPLTPSYQMEKIKPRPVASPARRLSKSEALELVRSLRGYIVVATVLGFATLGGLVANQIFTMGTNVDQLQSTPGIQAPFMRSHYPASQSNSGRFFNRHDHGQWQGQGGYRFGQSNISSPFSGSHTS